MKRYRWWILGALVAVPLLGCCGFFAEMLIAVWPSYDETKSKYAVTHADQLVAEAAQLIETANKTRQYTFQPPAHLPPTIAALQPLFVQVDRFQDVLALDIRIQGGFNHQGFFVIVDPGKSGAEPHHSHFKNRKLHERIIEYRE